MPLIQSGGKISPAILFIIVILAIVFFISGVLHLLVRFLMKQRSSDFQSSGELDMSVSGAFQRQLQHLFNLHDSGLDQAFIDSLPVFLYKDLVGLSEPYDCPVCLNEFSEQDKLRLLPLCSHAFHIDCIDTWLLSNSTCPLCRGTLLTEGFSMENPVFEFDDSRYDEFSGNVGFAVPSGPKSAETEKIITQKRVFSVRLGKFRNINEGGRGEDIEMGETSNSNLDARRCYSMGSYQYIVTDTELQVALCPDTTNDNDVNFLRGKSGYNGNPTNDGDAEGKKINLRSKGESFSVSKVWQWSSKKGKLAFYRDSHISGSVNLSLPLSSRIESNTG